MSKTFKTCTDVRLRMHPVEPVGAAVPPLAQARSLGPARGAAVPANERDVPAGPVPACSKR